MKGSDHELQHCHPVQVLQDVDWERQASSRDLDKCALKGIVLYIILKVSSTVKPDLFPQVTAQATNTKLTSYVDFLVLLQNLLHSLNTKDTLEI